MRHKHEKYIKAVNKAVKRAESSDPFRIWWDYGIIVKYVPLGSLKGFTATNYRIRTIFINEDLDEIEAKFTCAHELGHILMRHDYNKLWLANHTFYNLDRYENDANRFAIYLLQYQWQDDIENMEYPSNENISNLTGIPVEYLNLL